jgi:hypothetical protein
MYLIDGALDGRELGDVARGQQVDANDGDTIRELFHIFPGTSQSVKMVQVGQRAEKGSGCQLTISNHQSSFSRPFKLKHFNHRT